MKQSLVLILLFLSPFIFCQKDDTLRQLLDKIVSHAEGSSLYRMKVDWVKVKNTMSEMSKDAASVSDLSTALKYLLQSMGDEHGRIFYKSQMIAYYYGEQKDHQKSFNSRILHQIQEGEVYKFETRLLQDNVGYVRIVGLPMGDNTLMAKQIQEKICELAAKGAKKWILDLRYNGGGNMHPMAEGISLLIGNGNVGGSKGLTENENSSWNVKEGDFYYDDYSIRLKNDCKIRPFPKVAVLTSLYTTSSGEAIAVMFKGRKNTRFFGHKTLGMITVTDWKVLDESTTMTISVSYYMDRKGKVYTNYVDVDEITPFEEMPLSENDKATNQALLWLKGKS